MLTVISPAAHHRLTTLEAVKNELSLTNTADDAFLSDLIDQASDIVRTWCGRSFALEGVRETLHHNRPGASVMLSRWPVASIDAVTIDGRVFDPVNFQAEDGAGIVYRIGADGCTASWPSGRTVIEYTAGYVLPNDDNSAEPTLPKDIERAAIILVKTAYFARGRDPLIRTEDVSGIASTTYWVGGFGNGATLPPDVEGLLSPHRQVLIG